MKISRSLIFLCFISTIIACNENLIFKEFNKDFPQFRWEKTKQIEFSPEITDISNNYSVSLELRHVFGFQFKDMKVQVETISPSGKSSIKPYEFAVMDQNNEYLSECSVDICDLKTTIEENMKFEEAGTYKYIIEHNMPVHILPNVMEMGLIIEKHSQK